MRPGGEDPADHRSLRTLASIQDTRAPIEDRTRVGACRVCGRLWTFRVSGDSHYGWNHQVTPFSGTIVDTCAASGDHTAMADRLVRAFVETPGAIDDDVLAVVDQLVDALATSDPGRSQALDAARQGWLGDDRATPRR